MGLTNIYEALTRIEDRRTQFHDEKALWTAALNGEDSLAAAALDRFLPFGGRGGGRHRIGAGRIRGL
jgi:glucokinase